MYDVWMGAIFATTQILYDTGTHVVAAIIGGAAVIGGLALLIP